MLSEALSIVEIGNWLDNDVSPGRLTPWFDAEALLEYEPLSMEERDRAILSVVREIENDALQPSGGHRLPAWERGWGEILDNVRNDGLAYDNLRPQYFRHGTVRLRQDYVSVDGPQFEFALCHAVKAILYRQFLRPDDRIIDLGSGTSSNVYMLLEMFDQAEVIGCDWAEQSAELTNMVGAAFAERARGVKVDMLTLEGLDSVGGLEDAVVVSIHAFEQLGRNFGPILKAIASGGPRLVIQVEPILEHYDSECLIDYLAIRYHRKRNYLCGYLEALHELENRGRIEILKAVHLPIGNLFHEPYSVLVWRPV